MRLPQSQSGDGQGQETFLATSADKQTRNYDTECSNHHPCLSTLRSKGLSRSKMKCWAIYTNLPVSDIVTNPGVWHRVPYIFLFIITKWIYISTMPVISTKWKKWSNFLYLFIHLTLFPRSAKSFTNNFYSHLIFVALFFTNAFYFYEAEKTLIIYLTPI